MFSLVDDNNPLDESFLYDEDDSESDASTENQSSVSPDFGTFVVFLTVQGISNSVSKVMLILINKRVASGICDGPLGFCQYLLRETLKPHAIMIIVVEVINV